MNKEEGVKFLKIQTCVLKVYIHCDGCKQKVKKLLQKIDGVYTIAIDADQGKVTVSGNVDPAALIKKLTKNGKHAELLAPKPINNNNNKNQQLQQLNNLYQNPQLDNGKGGGQKDGGKSKKGGGGGDGGGGGGNNQKGQPQLPQLPQLQAQMKNFNLGQLKDLTMPFVKDPKNVKFNLPEDDDYSDLDDEFEDDFDDDDVDDMDPFDDFEEDLKPPIKMKPMTGAPVGNVMLNDKKVGGGGGGGENGKKGGGDDGNVVAQNKGAVCGSDGKNSNNNNGKKGAGGGGKNGGKNNGGGGQDGKNGGPNNNQGTKKGGKNDMGGNNPTPDMGKGGGFPVGMMPQHLGGGGGGLHPMQMGQMPPNANAVQGLPAAGRPPPGYFHGGPGMAPPPEVIASANPYQQQQYIAAMMQQQRMMMNGPDRTFQPMAYARPPVPINYIPSAPPAPPEYTHFFSDENTNSCTIM